MYLTKPLFGLIIRSQHCRMIGRKIDHKVYNPFSSSHAMAQDSNVPCTCIITNNVQNIIINIIYFNGCLRTVTDRGFTDYILID